MQSVQDNVETLHCLYIVCPTPVIVSNLDETSWICGVVGGVSDVSYYL